MKRLALIAATCCLGFLLTACGEDKTPVVKPTVDQETVVPADADTQPAPVKSDEPASPSDTAPNS